MQNSSNSSKQSYKVNQSRGCLSRILLLGCIIIFLLIIGFYIVNRIKLSWLPVDSTSVSEISIQIQPGSNVSLIAKSLKEHQLIQSDSSFILYCRLHQMDKYLQAGHYQFSPSQSVAEIAEIIANGQVIRNLITIPEGFTVKQISTRFIESGLVDEEDFKEALQKDYNRGYIIQNNPSIREPLEGFLFPDTYIFPDDLPPANIIKLMLNHFDEVWERVTLEKPSEIASEFSVREIVTIASLIERECQVESEQARIAGVIYNRLKCNMPLQIDASVLYALGEHKENILLSDLEIDSPYNTYLYSGLPPGPIACPGEKALYAALHPEQNEFLYYVSSGNGSHEFSTNFEDHLQAQRKYQN